MDKEAVGWDWIGINLADGGALMAFRMRDEAGGKFWAGGAYRAADGRTRIFEPGEVDFTPLRSWRSSRSDAVYPVAWQITAGNLKIDVAPLMDDQENDTRASTGTIYWEGAVRALQDGKPVGRGLSRTDRLLAQAAALNKTPRSGCRDQANVRYGPALPRHTTILEPPIADGLAFISLTLSRPAIVSPGHKSVSLPF